MPAPNDPRKAGAPKPAAATPPAPARPRRPSPAQPESTVTLMVQSGQAPGGLASKPMREAAPQKRAGALARAWAAFKSWF